MTPEFWWFGVAHNHRRSTWRLRVQLPNVDEDTAELFLWLRQHVIPCCLAAPFRVTLELVPPEDIRPISEHESPS